MRFRLVIFGVVIVSVCSCFLKQEAPGTGPTQPTKSVPIQGVVTLEELQGAQAMAAVMAKFYPKEVSRERDGLLSRLEIKGRGPSCIVDHQRLGKEEEEKGQ